MKNLLKQLIKVWPIGVVYRFTIFWRYIGPRLLLAVKWALKRTEYSNFYYDLTERNKQELASFVALVAGCPRRQVEIYIEEISQNVSLKKQMFKVLKDDKSMQDSNLGLGRRIGWYAFARATKPKVIVETGVHQGVGALVLISALMRNELEGHPGKYLGTDIDPAAGVLLSDTYLNYGGVLYGDSIESLRGITQPIDLFINDSDHSASYEAQEYKEIEEKLSEKAIILGDNSHVTSSLLDFSTRTGRSFLFFKEAPLDHWYPGAGIGVSFKSIP